jgi:8-oxo-dGTP pyrophosphatase MutT (NUDIX family)
LPPAAQGGDPQAAVAIIRTTGHDPQYLLLRRAVNPVDPWSGHFALPGGRREASDRDILQTCIRETLEEIGLLLSPEQLIDARPWARAGGTAHSTLVAPFLFEIPEPAPLTLDTTEIAESHWLTRGYLLNPDNHTRAVMSPLMPERAFPCIKVGTGAIWGFTYGVLSTLLDYPRK